jgi:ADP-ribose pyrophosphatase YjhB (NUDIX family)
MENNESSQQGALRETWEEARAKIDSPQLYRFFDLPYISQVYLFYRGDVIDGAFEAGPESLEVSLFAESQIPWQELAFPVVKQMLEEYFEDRKIQKYPIRSSTIERLIS